MAGDSRVPKQPRTAFGFIALAGVAIMATATIGWRGLEPVQDSSIEEMYQMLWELAWACGGFLVSMAGIGWLVARAQQRAHRRNDAC